MGQAGFVFVLRFRVFALQTLLVVDPSSAELEVLKCCGLERIGSVASPAVSMVFGLRVGSIQHCLSGSA